MQPSGSSILLNPAGSTILGSPAGNAGVNNATNVGIPISSQDVSTVVPNTTNTTNTSTTTGATTGGSTSTTLSPDIINAALTSIANQIAQNQGNFNAASATNANNDTQQQLNEKTQEQNNTGSRSVAVQNAEQAAAQGNQGLKAVLASLGALNGTGQVLAGRAVASSANGDIGTANNTFTTNDQAIQKAIADYQTQVNARNATLQDSLNTDNRNAQTTGTQDIINQAENIGDTATVAKYLPQLVASTAPTTPITPTPVLYNGATVGAYSPTNSVNVTAAPASSTAGTSSITPVNSALYVKKTGATPA